MQFKDGNVWKCGQYVTRKVCRFRNIWVQNETFYDYNNLRVN